MSGIVMTLIGSLAGAAKDTFFRYVSLLLPGNGTNGAQNNTFLDGSTNNFTITRNGNTTQGTFTPYGSNWSNYFDGTGDYLTVPDNAAFNFGNGDFTVEFWVYATTTGQSANSFLYSKPDGSGFSGVTIVQTSGAYTLRLFSSSTGTAWNLANNAVIGTMTQNTWHHVAITRSGTNMYAFMDGVLGSTTSVSTTSLLSTTGLVSIVSSLGATNSFFSGYVSNLRVVKGTAVYTSAFTPPTAPLTAITNTSLLTCQSNRFRDNSTNNFTITRNGDVSVQRFSPFSPSAAYSASVIGGSGYFDGNGDYLAVPANAAFNFGTGAFTLECWAYRTGAGSGDRFLIDQQNGVQYTLRYNASGVLQLILLSGVALSYTFTMAIGEWYHIVAVRSGSSLALFVNGVRQATGTSSSSIGSNTEALAVGAKQGGGTDFFAGYISNVRIVKGTAVYDPSLTTLTVPTAPLTAITNTSLLLNFTNAGIIDNAMMNDLETRGNAQISTAQSKFGGSSMYFDGTGDYLIVPNSTALQMGSGDFTLEFWIYFASISGYQTPFDKGYTSGGGLLLQTGLGNGRLIVYAGGSAVITETGTGSTGVWIHYALVRNGTTLTLYRDGTSSGSATNSTNFNNANQVGIGATGTAPGGGSIGDFPINGYIDDLRITKGVARYTANFTPPSQAFPTS